MTRRPPTPSGSSAFPLLFVLLWSTGFIAAKYGLPYAPPLSFLLYRFVLVAALMMAVALATRAPMAGHAGARSGMSPCRRWLVHGTLSRRRVHRARRRHAGRDGRDAGGLAAAADGAHRARLAGRARRGCGSGSVWCWGWPASGSSSGTRSRWPANLAALVRRARSRWPASASARCSRSATARTRPAHRRGDPVRGLCAASTCRSWLALERPGVRWTPDVRVRARLVGAWCCRSARSACSTGCCATARRRTSPACSTWCPTVTALMAWAHVRRDARSRSRSPAWSLIAVAVALARPRPPGPAPAPPSSDPDAPPADPDTPPADRDTPPADPDPPPASGAGRVV